MSAREDHNGAMIEVKEVYKSFKDVHAVKGITFSVKKGSFLGLLGPNGAGKTTLVEMIEGIQKPDKGEILIAGMKWHGHEKELRKIIGLSFQETHFIDKLRVTETLKLFACFYNLDKKRVEEIIDLVGLDEKRKARVENLSGGQRQWLALGIALLNSPQVILLDEPTTGLDPNARREIWTILQQLRERSGTSMVLTTHYMEEAEKLCDYIVIMDHGVILKEGTPDDLLSDNGSEKLVEFTVDKPSLISEKGFSEINNNKLIWDRNTEKGIIKIKQFENDLPDFFASLEKEGLKVKNFECRKKTLDDLFTTLTGRHLHE
jgi:ABC-2 type transport system ATP-binding protein